MTPATAPAMARSGSHRGILPGWPSNRRSMPSGYRPARTALFLHTQYSGWGLKPEYVTSDLVTPFKKHIGSVYRTIEDRVARAVRVAFNLPAELPQEWAEAIDRADHAAAYLEAVHLAGFSEQEARTLFDFRRRAPIIDIEPWEARVAKDRFLAVFDDLVAGGHGCRTIWAGQPLWAVPELQLVEARSA